MITDPTLVKQLVVLPTLVNVHPGVIAPAEPKATAADMGPTPPPLTIISRNPTVTVTSDTRGNLGPCSVVVQDPPGTDWIKDRWQAASDMGGTAIPGVHYVALDFHRTVLAHTVHLDWETAFSGNLRICIISVLLFFVSYVVLVGLLWKNTF